MTETPRLTLWVKYGSPEQTWLSDWKYPFLCLSQRNSHTVQRPNRHLRMHLTSYRADLGAWLQRSYLHPNTHRGDMGWPHTPGHCLGTEPGFEWNSSTQVCRSTGGILGYNTVYSSFAEGWRGLLFISGEKTITKKHTKKTTQTSNKNKAKSLVKLFSSLGTWIPFLNTCLEQAGVWAGRQRLETFNSQFISQQLCSFPNWGQTVKWLYCPERLNQVSKKVGKCFLHGCCHSIKNPIEQKWKVSIDTKPIFKILCCLFQF